MGFQFNHVGGGTKTRRPITLHMKYNSGCVQPVCFLVTEDAGEAELSLEELQVRERQGRKERTNNFRMLSLSRSHTHTHTRAHTHTHLCSLFLTRSTSNWRTRAWSGTNSSGRRRSWCAWSTSTAPT